VETHLAKVLEAFLRCFEVNIDWMGDNFNSGIEAFSSSLAGEIIQETLYTQNMAEINSRRIIPIGKHCLKYDYNLYLIRGIVTDEKNLISVGVAQWKNTESYNEYIEDLPIINVPAKDYYDVINNEFEWKQRTLTGEYLIFDLGAKGAYSKCWKPVTIEEIPKGISMLKLSNEFNGGYVLVKNVDEHLRIVELDPWYIKHKEIYRILYALNYENNTQAEFKVKHYIDFSVLKCSGAMPETETRLLMECSWPYRTFEDKYTRIIPKFLWKLVDHSLQNLGIKLVVQ